MCLNLVTLYIYVYRTPNDGMAINAIHSHLPRFNDLIKYLSMDTCRKHRNPLTQHLELLIYFLLGQRAL